MGASHPVYTADFTGNAIDYNTALVWGTGINPVHAEYGSDALRVGGRQGNIPDVTSPAEAIPDIVEYGAPWGYQPEDIAGLDFYGQGAVTGEYFHQDDLPDWGQETPETRADVRSDMRVPWGSPGWLKEKLRLIHAGAWSYDDSLKTTRNPTETVNEGWLNKPKGPGEFLAGTSDTSQYEVQTSMQQRTKSLENVRAVARGTDDSRESIASREAGPKLKVYSGERRHYDMFPYQQDMIVRPFRYRTAALPTYYGANDTYVIEALQRTPPADPYPGAQDIALSEPDYGYTGEDAFYA